MTRVAPVELPASEYEFPDPLGAGPDDVVAVGGDLAPGTLLAAYRVGLFPMYLPHGPLAWWSPHRRGVIPLDGLKVSRSLRRSVRRFQVTADQRFEEVIGACADESRPGGWITDDIRRAYIELHRLGWAHSVEVWLGGELVGGLYGVGVAGLFAGESMFHRVSDASKVGLLRLVQRMRASGGRLLDVQWATDHLQTLGAVEVDRVEYRRLLDAALQHEPSGLWPNHR